MIKINFLKEDIRPPLADVGQVRSDNNGRTVMIVRDNDLVKGRIRQSIRVVILESKGFNGSGSPFELLASEYKLSQMKELEDRYPILLEGELTIK